jgi:hypothetical protein
VLEKKVVNTQLIVPNWSVEMCDDLKLGFGERKQKSNSTRCAKRYFFWFVRGYFDGDGNVWWDYTKGRKFGLYVQVVSLPVRNISI